MTPTPNKWFVFNESDLARFIEDIRYTPIPKKGLLFQWGRIKNVRSLKQNNALHLYFEMLANSLNEADLLIRMDFLGKSIEVPWCKETVKEHIWGKAMVAATGKTSTTELERHEVSEIYDILNAHFSTHHGLYVAFPERDWA